jgi:Tfp pilus assembly protein FimT
MMVTLTVIGLVLAVGVPATMKYMRSSEVAGARNTLIADLHYAHSLAGMRRRTYEISFTPNTYTIAQVSPATTILTRTMPGGVVCAATDTATFFAWGLSVPISVTVKHGSDSTTVQLAANGSVSHD